MWHICAIVVRSVSKASLNYVRPIAQRDKLRLIRILAPRFKSSSKGGLFAFWRFTCSESSGKYSVFMFGNMGWITTTTQSKNAESVKRLSVYKVCVAMCQRGLMVTYTRRGVFRYMLRYHPATGSNPVVAILFNSPVV